MTRRRWVGHVIESASQPPFLFVFTTSFCCRIASVILPHFCIVMDTTALLQPPSRSRKKKFATLQPLSTTFSLEP